MKARFNHWYNAVLTALLSVLGYGCSSEEPMDEYGPPIMEYGAPHADYIIKGTVTDESGTPVQGIKTSLQQVNRMQVYCIESVQTNASGSYQLKHTGVRNQDYKVIAEDIDGEANGGEYLSDTLDIDYDKAVKVKDGDGSWYLGEYEIPLNVRLKKKP